MAMPNHNDEGTEVSKGRRREEKVLVPKSVKCWDARAGSARRFSRGRTCKKALVEACSGVGPLIFKSVF